MKNILLIITLTLPVLMFSQNILQSKLIDEFSASIGITNNGISLIPTFSLSEPAATIGIKLTKSRFSFEPDLRFSLKGKPWSFLFWFRHQTIKKDKFKLRVGINPALNFRTIKATINGNEREFIETRRYLRSEIVPSYKIFDKITIGMHYIYSHGIDDGIKNTHFISSNVTFNKIPLTKNKKYNANISQRLYYLILDHSVGYYTATLITIKKKEFPLSLQSILNHKIDSDIPSDNIVWNISLVYKFE